MSSTPLSKSPAETKILVVDDEEDLREAIAFDFERKGYQVFQAENGKIAFELVKSQAIDVIITDVRMPVADGVQLLKWVKDLNRSLPVVMFITGFADLSLEDAYNEGADAVFAKPFDRKALSHAVEKALLHRHQAWTQQVPATETPVSIELQLPNSLAPSPRFNLGRGGAFVSCDDGNGPMTQLRPNAVVQFHLRFADPATPPLKGEGIVRWVRAEAQGDLPAGCGIEFQTLEDDCRTRVITLLEEKPARAFIPKK